MKLLIKIVAPVAVMFTAATAVALAAPVTPTDVYPNVPANADVCQVEKLEIQRQQLEFDQARRDYDRTAQLVARGAASMSELRAAERALHQAGIRLNAAKYAEAACRNNLGNAANKACIALALELNRLIDELPLRRELERLAIEEYNVGLQLARRNAISQQELERLRLAAQVATIERQQAEQRIADQRRRIADNPACRNFPSERPAQAPPPREVPTSTQPAPTPTGTVPTTGSAPSGGTAPNLAR
ncbi:MAG TPA: hypothetical protein VFV67_06390 [Actinophytocola sp.]|uniref:hypothetical protein n=1 Tax=Actinophytocola sp. TaxID=1872138 RepID=UPI002DBE88CA|nr:hypothetical protein [Actinophytocola sp.]HEU5470263.1 hypothetical protein [Actinophytocola sp.]